MGTVTVDQAKLVLNSFMTVFEDNLVTGEAVSWHEHDGELDDNNRLTVVEQVTPRYNVTRTTGGVKDLTAGTDGTVFGSEQFAITGTFNANMGWGDFIKIRDIGAARESKALIGAATSMAEKIDAYILGIAALASPNWLGTIGNNVSDYIDCIAPYTRLKEDGVGDNDLRLIMSHIDRQLLGDQVVNLPNDTGDGVYRKGFKGMIGDMPTLFTNSLPVLTTGTRSNLVADSIEMVGAAQNVNYADVAVSTAPGRFMTQTISIDGAALGVQTIKAGEVFTIAGVYSYDNRKQAAVNPPRLQQFTVVDDATAVAGAITALRIFPAMIVPASGAGDNININTAHATVTAAPADNADLTFLGAASTAYGPRLLIQKEAIEVNTIPLVMPATGIAMRKKLSRIPLTVRMWQHSDFNTGAHNVRFDVALDANIRSRARMAKFNGA